VTDEVETIPSGHLAGVPDEFQRLWTPHRMAYINAGTDANDGDRCPFCRVPEMSDEDGLIVFRGQLAYVVMNLYPYNSGHVLVCPFRHVALYDEATPEEIAEIGILTQEAMRVVRAVFSNEGFNLGMNQGRVSGAGVAEHLHQHIVPRWSTDANFMPIIAKTKAMPRLLSDVRKQLAEAWEPHRYDAASG
jgi:ATP adenylyltransferase